jgi:hypothetical protein
MKIICKTLYIKKLTFICEYNYHFSFAPYFKFNFPHIKRFLGELRVFLKSDYFEIFQRLYGRVEKKNLILLKLSQFVDDYMANTFLPKKFFFVTSVFLWRFPKWGPSKSAKNTFFLIFSPNIIRFWQFFF